MKFSKIIFLVFLLFPFAVKSQTPFVSKVWKADNGNGTFTNPILHADYSDPDAIRVGDDFYMTASSFNSAPGLPVLHSKDLVNWQLINYVFTRQMPYDVFANTQHGGGVWAPAIRYHNGEYYIFNISAFTFCRKTANSLRFKSLESRQRQWNLYESDSSRRLFRS